LEGRLESFHAKNLPEQLIHGDLHYDNVLYDPENQQVTGLLDFEYCGFDWRAMELAICLSKYAGEPNPLKYFEEFVSGFAQTAQLTEDEIDSVPDLIVLRILSNVVFFVGRTITGEDDAEQLTSRAGMYSARIEWLLDNRETITKLIEREMAKRS
jgi:Ser/Thr protein kinase RdoA (MazF antagonist)